MTQQAVAIQHLLSETELYLVYLEVARRDHQWRIQALYGQRERPASHTPFRPLDQATFAERRQAVKHLPEGLERFQQQLLRRAHSYRVDVARVINASDTHDATPPVSTPPVRRRSA